MSNVELGSVPLMDAKRNPKLDKLQNFKTAMRRHVPLSAMLGQEAR